MLDRRGVGFPSATQPTGEGTGRTARVRSRAIGDGTRPGAGVSSPGMIEDGSEVGATCKMAVCVGDPGALLVPGSPPSRDYHRADMVPIRREEETSVVSHRTGRVESLR